MSILALAGSLRKGSYNRIVVEAAVELAPSSVSIRPFDIASIPVFSEDLECGSVRPQSVARLCAAIAESDGLLIATPEYNQSVPGVVKNMIDWLSRSEPGLEGLPVAVTGASTGPWGTRIAQTVLKQMLHSTGALVMSSPMLFIPRVESLLDGTRLADEKTRRQLGDLVVSFVDWIDRVGVRSQVASQRPA